MRSSVLAARFFAPEFCQRRYFTHLVTAGLAPAVHADLRLRKTSSANPIKLSFRMDCRIKSGNDDKANKGWRNAERRIALRSASRMRRAPKRFGARSPSGVPPRLFGGRT